MPGTYISPAETGFYYLQSRYYDPEIGRFINADALMSTGQGFIGTNMFAYCGNNPVNYSDPTGESALGVLVGILKAKAPEAVVDGLAGGIIDGVCTFATGGSWGEVGGSFLSGFIKSFIYGYVDDYLPVSKINSGIAATKECLKSGAGWGKSLAAGAVAILFSYSFTNDSDGKIGKFVDFVFGLGGSLMSSAVTKGIVGKSSNSTAESAVPTRWHSAVDAITSTPSVAPGGSGIYVQISF